MSETREAALLLGIVLVWGILIGTLVTLVVQRYVNANRGRHRDPYQD